MGVAIMAILGVIVFAALLVGPPKPKFEITGWDVITNGWVSIEFTYSTDKPVDVTLIDPTGKAVGFAYPSAEATRDSVRMAPINKTPILGTYTLVVTYLDERIFETTFTFSGAEFSIGNILLDWSYDPTVGWYTLEAASVEFVNDGDLPAYIFGISGGEIDSTGFLGELVMGWIEPGRRIITWEPLADVESAGTYTLTIRVEEAAGKVLAERTFTVTVP